MVGGAVKDLLKQSSSSGFKSKRRRCVNQKERIEVVRSSEHDMRTKMSFPQITFFFTHFCKFVATVLVCCLVSID